MSEKLKRELRTILIALALFLAIIILDRSGAIPAVFDNPLASRAVYLIPYLISGLPVLRKAVLGIRNGQMLDESFLMTIASIGAFVTGEAEEAAAVMLFYRVGEFFQSYAVGRSRASISELMDIAPEYAHVLRSDGSVETVDVDEVEIGDTLLIKPGEKIPVDGSVIDGESRLNTSALTGESVPRKVRPSDSVISGCVNGEGLLKVRAEKGYDDSTVAKILELVENASEKKSRTENFITRFARIYTPIVVGAALVLAIIPSLLTGNWMEWIYRACTFLVISCPCALVISVPLAFFGGVGAASKNGVLVKGSNYLELLARLGIVVSDKTGTLTEGNFKVSALLPADGVSGEMLLGAAAEAEGLSTHPIALSIREAYAAARADAAGRAESPAGPEEDLRAEKAGGEENAGLCVAKASGQESAGGCVAKASGEKNAEIHIEKASGEENAELHVEEVSGQGIAARIRGSEILVGNARLMEAHGIAHPVVEDAAATLSYVAKDGRYLGAILVRDLVKEDARKAMAELRKQGVRRTVMLTGDRKGVAESVAAELGISECFSALLPADKVQKVEELLRDRGPDEVLAFIGDGINDAPVLTRADVGVAMGSLGSDAAIEAADVVIMDDNLLRLPLVMGIARKTVSISRENIAFALCVKLLILLLGALGFAGMWAAVFADVGVAVLCILNSMRLLLVRRMPKQQTAARGGQ